MGRSKSVKAEEEEVVEDETVVDESSEEAEAEEVEEAEEAPEAPAAKAKKGEWPEVSGNGKFQAVEVEGGFALYNPSGQRASGILTDAEVRDMVNRMNQAQGLK